MKCSKVKKKTNVQCSALANSLGCILLSDIVTYNAVQPDLAQCNMFGSLLKSCNACK